VGDCNLLRIKGFKKFRGKWEFFSIGQDKNTFRQKVIIRDQTKTKIYNFSLMAANSQARKSGSDMARITGSSV
jgi:hypothetical protein